MSSTISFADNFLAEDGSLGASIAKAVTGMLNNSAPTIDCSRFCILSHHLGGIPGQHPTQGRYGPACKREATLAATLPLGAVMYEAPPTARASASSGSRPRHPTS
jgi:hypothetical protein